MYAADPRKPVDKNDNPVRTRIDTPAPGPTLVVFRGVPKHGLRKTL